MTIAVRVVFSPVLANVFTVITDDIPLARSNVAVVSTLPVVTVFGIVAVADNSLTSAAPVTGIFCTVNIVTHPGCALVYHHLVAIIQIVVAVTRRQGGAVYPCVVLIIYILVSGDISIPILLKIVSGLG